MRNRVSIPDCEHCTSRECSLFHVLHSEELNHISAEKGGIVFKKGQHLFFEGTAPSGVYCIYKGKVKVYKLDANGNEQIVRLAKNGDMLGYRAIVTNEKYTSYAAALEDSVVCFIPRNVYLELLAKNNQFNLELIVHLSKELKLTEKRLAEMAQKPVRERMAEALLYLQEVYGVEEDGQTIDIRLKREDFAHLIGTTTETAIRLLSEFKTDGMIEINGRAIKILHPNKLTRLANIYPN